MLNLPLAAPLRHSSGKYERFSDAVLNARFNQDLTVNAPVPPPTIYLDSMATTRVDERVVNAMLPYFTERYGNPHSVTHRMGHDADLAVTAARNAVAEIINADPVEVVFTSGATESNNIAVKGGARAARAADPKRRLVLTSAIEHKCVLASASDLKAEGFEHVILPVDREGRLDVAEFERIIAERGSEVALVSIMLVNNEIGTIQDVRAAAQRAHSVGALFHTDAAQGFGKIPLDVRADEIDLLSLSSHKIYGPKGAGALFVSHKSACPGLRGRRVRLASPISGGGQERGIRSGTVAVPTVVGLGAAAELMRREGAADAKRIGELSTSFRSKVMDALPDVELNGPSDPALAWPGCVNLSFDCVEGESLMMGMDEVAVSSGSACTSKDLAPSYVLGACGKPVETAHSSIRFGLGRFTTSDEMDRVSDLVVKTVRKLRDLSPLWEMKQAGIDLQSIQWAEDHHH